MGCGYDLCVCCRSTWQKRGSKLCSLCVPGQGCCGGAARGHRVQEEEEGSEYVGKSEAGMLWPHVVGTIILADQKSRDASGHRALLLIYDLLRY